MEIKRDIYLDKLIRKKKNGLIKVVTGVRRCRKSYLLFHLFHNHLLNRPIGIWGRMHKAYLELYRPARYNDLILSGCRSVSLPVQPVLQ